MPAFRGGHHRRSHEAWQWKLVHTLMEETRLDSRQPGSIGCSSKSQTFYYPLWSSRQSHSVGRDVTHFTDEETETQTWTHPQSHRLVCLSSWSTLLTLYSSGRSPGTPKSLRRALARFPGAPGPVPPWDPSLPLLPLLLPNFYFALCHFCLLMGKCSLYITRIVCFSPD